MRSFAFSWKGKKNHGRNELKEFLLCHVALVKSGIGSVLAWGGKIKKILSYWLYRERGRYTGVFGHVGMGVLALIGVLLSSRVEGWLFCKEQQVERAGTVLASDFLENDTGTLVSERPRGQVVEYRVQTGDTVSGIAHKFGISIDTIVWENELKSVDDIKPGQIIRILPVVGIRHKVRRGETVYGIAKKYQVDAQALVDYPFNEFSDDENFSLAAGQEIIVPEGIKPQEVIVDKERYVAQNVAPLPGVVGEGNFIWPTSGKISQRFSWYHRGVDIANGIGTTVAAAQGGTVISVISTKGGYGNHVMVDHGNGQQTLYAHLSAFSVSAGQRVSQGQQLGLMGSTGRSTGSHLHFEVITTGGKTDPLKLLK